MLDANDDVTGDGILDANDILATETTTAAGTFNYQFDPRSTGAFVMVIDEVRCRRCDPDVSGNAKRSTMAPAGVRRHRG